MTNMNIYWNEEYCGSKTEFETLKKSRYIARSCELPAIRDWAKVVDPADTVGSLAKAHNVLRDGVDAEYLQAVMTGRPRQLAETNGFSWDDGIYQMVLNSTAGILCAVDDVLGGYDHACSLSSGLHHARRSRGSGFCTVNSLALGALYAEKQRPEGVAILDFDAHCGGGTNDYLKGTTIKQVDMSTSDFDKYEKPASGGSLSICLHSEYYLESVNEALNDVASIGPEIVFYNAGVDVFPFVEPDVVVKREAMVAERLRNLGAKTVIVMAGGYGNYEDIVPLHVATIMAFATPHLLKERVGAGRPNAGMFVGA